MRSVSHPKVFVASRCEDRSRGRANAVDVRVFKGATSPPKQSSAIRSVALLQMNRKSSEPWEEEEENNEEEENEEEEESKLRTTLR